MSSYEKTLKDIMNEVKETKVEAVFGEPRQLGSQTIIPVGTIAYGWGSGSGKGHNKAANEEGEGGGVGMGVKVKPLGYIDVTPEGASYRPIVDLTPAVTIGAGLVGLAALRAVHRLTKRRAA